MDYLRELTEGNLAPFLLPSIIGGAIGVLRGVRKESEARLQFMCRMVRHLAFACFNGWLTQGVIMALGLSELFIGPACAVAAVFGATTLDVLEAVLRANARKRSDD